MRYRALLATGLIAGAGVAVYVLTSLVVGGGESSANQAGPPAEATPEPGEPTPDTTATASYWEHPGDDVTPEPGSTPDRTRPFWHIPYVNQDRMKEPFQGELNGFLIQLNAPDNRQFCESPELPDAIDARGTPMNVFPNWLPDETTVEPRGALGMLAVCDGVIVHASQTFAVPAEPPDGRIGGTLNVIRMIADPVVNSTTIPRDRWEAGSLAGRPAVVARPILPEIGVGTSYIAVWEADTRILTLVWADGLPADETRRIAEGLFE